MGIVSKLAYQGLLIADESTAVDKRPAAQKILDFNQNRFNLESNVIYCNVLDSKARFTATRSCYNDKHVAFTTNLVKELVEHSVTDIAVLVGYEAQYWAHISAISKLSGDVRDVWDHVIVDKIDKRQGAEFNVVIADFCNNEVPGFMGVLQRANTILSRVKNGFYVLMDANAVGRFKGNGRVLKKVDKLLKPFHVLIKESELAYYTPG